MTPLSDVTVAEGWVLIVGLVGFVMTLWGVGTKVLPFVRKTSHLIDDLVGQDERPGQARQPGLMERLGSVEKTVSGYADLSTRQAAIEQAMVSGFAAINEKVDTYQLTATRDRQVLHEHVSDLAARLNLEPLIKE